MDEKNTFIQEVTSDLRQERLYKAFRRYAWVGILAVIAVVGGTAFNEYQKNKMRQTARLFGEKIFSALDEADQAKARTEISALTKTGDGGAVTSLIGLGFLPDDARARQSRLGALKALSEDETLSPLYRDLARLGWVIAADDSVGRGERLAQIDLLSAPGGAFRSLAQEQRAYILLELEKHDEALEVLRQIIAEEGVSSAIGTRSERLMIALGADNIAPDTHEPDTHGSDAMSGENN